MNHIAIALSSNINLSSGGYIRRGFLQIREAPLDVCLIGILVAQELNETDTTKALIYQRDISNLI